MPILEVGDWIGPQPARSSTGNTAVIANTMDKHNRISAIDGMSVAVTATWRADDIANCALFCFWLDPCNAMLETGIAAVKKINASYCRRKDMARRIARCMDLLL